MLEVGGKPLLFHAVERFQAAGVTDVLVVRGYRTEAVHCRGVRFRDFADWSDGNMLSTLMSARDELVGDVVVTYADILFNQAIVDAAVAADGALRPVVDLLWRDAYVGRMGHPTSEAEKVQLSGDLVRRIGKRNVRDEDAAGEFIGMLKLSAEGAEQFKHRYRQIEIFGLQQPFQTAATLQAAYLTDMLQDLCDRDARVQALPVRGGWREIDTEEDLRHAEAWFCTR